MQQVSSGNTEADGVKVGREYEEPEPEEEPAKEEEEEEEKEEGAEGEVREEGMGVLPKGRRRALGDAC